jgi:carbamoyltransferase
MAAVLGINAVFHDPAAALVVDGVTVAASEEERFTRRKHGKVPVAFSTWELPEQSARWCLATAGIDPSDLDAVAYSYDPALLPEPGPDVTAHDWEPLRSLFVRRAPRFLETALPGLRRELVRFVPHHVAHAASAYLAAPHRNSATMVVDGRGERGSFLAGHVRDGALQVLRTVGLPHSLGLLYESATAHLGFRRSSDEYKVMALAAYGEPVHAPMLRESVQVGGDGWFTTAPVDWCRFAPPGRGEDGWTRADADLAATVQCVLEESLVHLARWLCESTGETHLTLAGGVALNCVANSRLVRDTDFHDVWVQPAAGDAGTALGAALRVAHDLGDAIAPFGTTALGRAWDEDAVASTLETADVPFTRPEDLAEAVAEIIAADGLVAWVQGRSEWGPRALGHRSLLANPRRSENLTRLNAVKGREQFRPVAPMVLAERAAEIFDGPLPSPYMLFTHRVRPAWRDRIPAVVHVDGTARIQTVDGRDEPLLARMLGALGALTGVPVCVNTSLNTGGRPMVDSPRDALECFGSGPIDALAIGPYLVRRRAFLPDAQTARGRAA